MRILVATVLAASLVATNLFAAEATNAPLAPGQAAGVKKVQDADMGTLWWVLGGAAAVGIIVAASSGGATTQVSSGTQ